MDTEKVTTENSEEEEDYKPEEAASLLQMIIETVEEYKGETNDQKTL